MPRSIQEILDHGDELASRFEEYDPKAGDERVVEEYLLERATIDRARSERQISHAPAGSSIGSTRPGPSGASGMSAAPYRASAPA